MRKRQPEHRVQISGPLTRAVLDARGLPLRAAIEKLREQEVKLSLAGLGKIVAAEGIVTTRASVRRVLAEITNVTEAYLSGMSGLSLGQALADGLASVQWDNWPSMREIKGDKGSRQTAALMTALGTARREVAADVRPLLDLDVWRGYFGNTGDKETVKQETRDRFAVAMTEALGFVFARPIPRHAALRALRNTLEKGGHDGEA